MQFSKAQFLQNIIPVQARKQVTELGGTITEEVDECTVLVTDKIRRTAKFLCMVAKGVPIVSPNWVKMSKEMKRFQGETFF